MRSQTSHSAPLFQDALKVAAFDPAARAAFSYSVLDEAPRAMSGDKRTQARRRTRLRAGKILDGANGFLVECRIHDRSTRGARLRLLADKPLPRRLRLFEDEGGALAEADIIWRNGSDVGVRFVPRRQKIEISRGMLAALRGKYYAIGS